MIKIITIFFIALLFCHEIYSIKPQVEDLENIIRVEQKNNAHFYILKARLRNGLVLKYRETISGENVGFATCCTMYGPADSTALINEEKGPLYWLEVLKLKLNNQ